MRNKRQIIDNHILNDFFMTKKQKKSEEKSSDHDYSIEAFNYYTNSKTVDVIKSI